MDASHLRISPTVTVPLSEIEWQAVRAQGSGGQNVNKVASAVQLFFDIDRSSLPEACKETLKAFSDQRITKEGVIVIKAQEHRTQEKNREAALLRLRALLKIALKRPRKRRATRPSRTARAKRMDSKTRHGQAKALRRRIDLG